ncbi:MAG: PQQ-binding-like beta-propeller repeat protein [Thermoanaerobaculia bacterium]|nr:PQQ-binding-like beta-propeller repeat protein [Thermoanaerobaculia bacterium]
MRGVAPQPPAAAALLAALALPLLPAPVGAETPAWPQWGGPGRDFVAPAEPLAESWPEGGPEELWSRPLGDGYSAILFEAGRLYTMYRSGGDEVVVSLDAATGETLWEHRYEQAPHPRHLPQYGDGPRATPLLAGDRLFTVGVAGRLLALDKRDGTPLWSRELWGEEVGGRMVGSGYSSSPLAHEGLVIVPVGGEEIGVAAFDQEEGTLVWASRGSPNSYSSPAIREIAGRRQLLSFMAEELLALDPDTGAELWSFRHGNQWGHNIHMPAAVDDLLFLSSPQAGSRGLRLVPEGGGYRVEALWSTRRVQLYHVSSVKEGEWIYGSTGVTAPAFLVAMNIRTGEIAWRERGLAKANCVAAGDRLVILDEHGILYLATASPEGFEIHARAPLRDRPAGTGPPGGGPRLFARDLERIRAFELGARQPVPASAR